VSGTKQTLTPDTIYKEITTMQRTFIAFLSTLVLSTLFAPTANAAQVRVQPGISPQVANELSQADPNEPLPFHIREYLQNSTVGR
jgi:glycerol-3-phosphate responsive antiterminator